MYWEGTVECPGSTPNQTCTLNITTSSGHTFKRTLPNGAAWQDGPNLVKEQAYGCQWQVPLATLRPAVA